MQIRRNQAMSDAVEQAIVIAELSSPLNAWAYLELHRAPSELIARVLANVEARRKSDTPSPVLIERCRTSAQGRLTR